MRTPLKLNKARWPNGLTVWLPSAADPRVLSRTGLSVDEFSEAVSSLKFGTTYKTTQKARFPLTLKALSELSYDRPPVILDVGASDGITSLDVMEALPFQEYYVTDKYLEILTLDHAGKTYFYGQDGRCILVAAPAWLAYADIGGAIPPFGAIARSLVAAAPRLPETAFRIELVTPELRARGRNVRVQQYHMLQPWPHEKSDLIIAANCTQSRLLCARGDREGSHQSARRFAPRRSPRGDSQSPSGDCNCVQPYGWAADGRTPDQRRK